MLALPFLAMVHRPKLGVYDPVRNPKRKPPRYWSIKLDGYCLLVHKDELGNVACFTRKGEQLTQDLKWHSVYTLAMANMPCECVVAGELHTNGTSSQIRTAINAKDPILEFTAFGVPSMQYTAGMMNAELRCTMIGYSFVQWGRFDANLMPFPADNNCAHLIPKGIEGYVFRDGQYSNMLKWKPTRTIDLIVAGVERGKDKYSECAGALVLHSSEGYEVGRVSSGLTDAQRYQIWNDRYRFVASIPIVEVAYDSIAAEGGLRFPRLLRFRTDKTVGMCSIAQDLDLQEYYENAGCTENSGT